MNHSFFGRSVSVFSTISFVLLLFGLNSFTALSVQSQQGQGNLTNLIQMPIAIDKAVEAGARRERVTQMVSTLRQGGLSPGQVNRYVRQAYYMSSNRSSGFTDLNQRARELAENNVTGRNLDQNLWEFVEERRGRSLERRSPKPSETNYIRQEVGSGDPEELPASSNRAPESLPSTSNAPGAGAGSGGTGSGTGGPGGTGSGGDDGGGPGGAVSAGTGSGTGGPGGTGSGGDNGGGPGSGNPGNDKDVGGAGESPGDGDFGDGEKGKSDVKKGSGSSGSGGSGS